jgi:hypothetical protein
MKTKYLGDYRLKKEKGKVQEEITNYYSTLLQEDDSRRFEKLLMLNILNNSYSEIQRVKICMALISRYGIKDCHIKYGIEFSKFKTKMYIPKLHGICEDDFKAQVLIIKEGYDIGFRRALELVIAII